jgi:hypothetical protein
MLATNESTKPWLDEGFTSYAEIYVMYQLFPKPNEANPFINSLKVMLILQNLVEKNLHLGYLITTIMAQHIL